MAIARESFSKQFQEYLRIMYEGRWYIAIIFVIVVSATWLYTLQQDDIYSAKTIIRIKRATDILAPGASMLNENLGWEGERIIANEIRVIQSDRVARIVTQMLLARAPRNDERQDTLPILKAKSAPSTFRKILRLVKMENLAVSIGLARLDTSTRIASDQQIMTRLKTMLSVMPVRGVDFVDVVVESSSKREAMLVANFVAEAYIERNKESARQSIKTAREYLEEQRNTKQDSLRSAENDLKAFQQQHGIVSLDAESQGLIGQLSTFEAQLENARIELQGTQKVLSETQRQLNAVEPNIASSLAQTDDPKLKSLLKEKVEIEIALSNADYSKKTYLKDQRPEMVEYAEKEIKDKTKRYEDVNRQIEQLTTKMLKSDAIASTPLESAKQLKQDIVKNLILIESLKAKVSRLDQVVAELNAKFETLPEQGIAFARLERARQGNEKLFSLLEQKFQETVINEQTTMGNAEIFDVATMPTKPTRPNRPMNMLLGVIVALGLGIAVAVVLKYLDTTIRNPEDLEKLGFSVLSFIPTFTDKNDTKRSETLIAYAAPQSPASESYRTLRTSVENLLSKNGQSLVVIVTSPAPKEGKSTVVGNLAVSSAISGRRVLLIDADLRRPVQHQIFEVEREPGFTDLIIGKAPVKECIRKTIIPGLHIVPSGHIPSHPAELLGSDRTLQFLAAMRKYYDFILIDSPPIIAMADTLVLARHTDGVCLVVSADSTKTMGIEKARQILESNGGAVIGAIVNRFNASKIYYSYYRYYYQNYYYYSEDGSKVKKEKTSRSRKA